MLKQIISFLLFGLFYHFRLVLGVFWLEIDRILILFSISGASGTRSDFKGFLCPSSSLCLALIRWIASSCFLPLFRTFSDSFIQSLCFWHHWYAWNKYRTLHESRPYSAHALLVDEINWFQLLPHHFVGFPVSFIPTQCLDEICICSIFANHVICSTLKNTFQSWHHGGDFTLAGSPHHRVVGVGNHSHGMSVTQEGGPAIWLANFFVPDICGKQAECHFKQWPVHSDLRWEANCSWANHNVTPCQLLHHCSNNQCIQNNKPPEETVPAITLILPRITSPQKYITYVFLSAIYTNQFYQDGWKQRGGTKTL